MLQAILTKDVSELKPPKSRIEALIIQIIESGGGGGTTNHNLLINRDLDDQHPQSAITGLTDGLARLQSKSIADTEGYFTTDTVEGALAEVGLKLDGLESALDDINDVLEGAL